MSKQVPDRDASATTSCPRNSVDRHSVDRRQFGKAAGAVFGAAAGFHFFPALADKKLEKPTLAGIGAGGKGTADINGSQKAGFEVVALCDVVDTKRLSMKDVSSKVIKAGVLREQFSHAAFYTDYREMLADLGDKVDAVTVSTPDHHHYHASAIAMQAGKHVYCQKPLTHGIWEARMMAKIGQETGVKTQMGNQAHANSHMRRCIELIRAGVVGKVQEIHAWTNRPIWPQGFASPPKRHRCRPESTGSSGSVRLPLSITALDCSICMARLVGLWHRSPRRYGVSHHGHGVLGNESWCARQRVGEAKRCDRTVAAD